MILEPGAPLPTRPGKTTGGWLRFAWLTAAAEAAAPTTAALADLRRGARFGLSACARFVLIMSSKAG